MNATSALERPMTTHPDDDLLRLFEAVGQGDRAAMNRLFEHLYQRFRTIAREILKHERRHWSVHVTPLISEVYLRLSQGRPQRFKDRQHLFRAVARVVRHVLVDLARERKAQKRGGEARRLSLSSAGALLARDEVEVLELHDLLEGLRAEDDRAATVAELRLFAGLKMAEMAATLGVSERTAAEDWRFARAWL